MKQPAKTILVAEDTPNIRYLLRVFLERRGCRVLVAVDGLEAVSMAVKERPDLILMDVIMPGKDGIAACGELRQMGIKTPIVMLTSKAYAEDKQRALDAGADAYLLKPFNPATLEAAIGSFLDS